MDEKLKNELMAVVSGAVSESNSKWDEYWAKVEAKDAEIAQLQADIKGKEAEIAQLRADFEKANAAQAAAEAGLTEANAAKEAAEAGLAEANSKIAALENESAIAELNAALAPYTEEQRAIAKEEIDAFNANPGSVEINTIVGKICTEMVRVSRENHISETNATNEIDVFAITDSPKQENDDGEVNVF